MGEATTALAPAGPSGLRHAVLVAGLIVLADLSSQLLIALGRWQPDLPFWKLAALQTAGTQTTPLVLGLVLLFAGLAGGARSHLVLPRVAILMALLGVAVLGLASEIPGATRIFLDLPGVVEQERLLRGSRQALVALPVFGVWSVLVAAALWRGSRPDA